MEVIRINRERIKIMLSPADMVEMDISCEVLDNFDKRGKEAFGKIMQEARDKCGFISCGRKILVQVSADTSAAGYVRSDYAYRRRTYL